MCLNKQLVYNIKVKSRVCELFVLNNDDFFKLSVNFKGFVEKFLRKSLSKFLKLIEYINEITENINDVNVDKKPQSLEVIEECSENDIEKNSNDSNEDTGNNPKLPRVGKEMSPRFNNKNYTEDEDGK